MRSPGLTESGLSPEALEMLADFEALPEEQRQLFVLFVREVRAGLAEQEPALPQNVIPLRRR